MKMAVNWTLLSVSPYGQHYDVIVRWDPPPSADVSMGWMRLDYEVRYRDRNSTEWTTVKVQGGTQQTLYGLHVQEEYEVQVRCKMKSFTKFGRHSDAIFIQLREVPVNAEHLLVVNDMSVCAFEELFIGPRAKGKLEDLNFILSSGGMAPPCTPLFYQDGPLVDCIEVDLQDPADAEETDTQQLLGGCQPTGQRANHAHGHALGFGDDGDEGVMGLADRFEQDPPDLSALGMLLPTPTTTSTLLLPGQPGLKVGSPGGDSDPSPALDSRAPGPQAWLNTDFYAQVSDVMPSGGVVLSPGQQLRALETTTPPGAEEKEQKEGGEEEEDEREVEEEEVKKKKGVQKGGEGRDPGWEEQKQPFQLVVVGGGDNPGSDGYTSDAMSWQMSPVNGYHTLPAEPVGTAPYNAATTAAASAAVAGTEDYYPAYILPDSFPAARCLLPVSDYTIVQEVDCQHSLLLNPPLPPQPLAHQCLPQHQLKALAPVPVGYITPDLLGSITP
ncbi:hypothetical protein CRUP_038686 [Coryphaenoides rupestris]|nr:hypothetical protein CRUP_038686 [Coryphaenoides rupestris]